MKTTKRDWLPSNFEFYLVFLITLNTQMKVPFEVQRREKCNEIAREPRSILLVGEAKAGKSTLLRQIFDHLSDQRKPVFLYRLDSPLFEDIDNITSHILADLVRHFEPTIRRTAKRKSQTTEQILDATSALDAGGSSNDIFILLDDIDRHYSNGQRTLLYKRLCNLIDFSGPHNNLNFICTSAVEFFRLDRQARTGDSGLADRLETIEVGSLTLAETVEMIDSWLRKASVDRLEVSPDVYNFTFQETGGHPAILGSLLLEIGKRIEPGSGIRTIRSRFRDAAIQLGTTGLSFFQRFLQALELEEIAFLQALAQNVAVDDWKLERLKQLRLASSGLVLFPSETGARMTARIFGSWLKRFTSELFSRAGAAGSRTMEAADFSRFIADNMRRCFGSVPPDSEKEVQIAIRALIAGSGLKFSAEGPRTEFQERGYDVDFYLPDIDLAIEAKLAKSGRRLTKLLEEISIDVLAYATRFKRVLFVIYDVGGSIVERVPNALDYGMFVETVIIKH